MPTSSDAAAQFRRFTGIEKGHPDIENDVVEQPTLADLDDLDDLEPETEPVTDPVPAPEAAESGEQD